jgi:5-methylcytosine-specific restriction endonuclease McrA
MSDNVRDQSDRRWMDATGKAWKVPRTGCRLSGHFSNHRALRRFVIQRDCYTCQACGLIASHYDDSGLAWIEDERGYIPLQIDHMMPRSKGGSNHPDNLQLLCGPCNSRKGTRLS